MSDILPVCLQDILHSRKPDLRKRKIRKPESEDNVAAELL